jgi:hypothetical protein
LSPLQKCLRLFANVLLLSWNVSETAKLAGSLDNVNQAGPLDNAIYFVALITSYGGLQKRSNYHQLFREMALGLFACWSCRFEVAVQAMYNLPDMELGL